MSDWRARFKNWIGTGMTASLPTRVLLNDSAAIAPAVLKLAAEFQGQTLVIAPDSSAADSIHADISGFLQIAGLKQQAFPVPELTIERRRQWLPENEAARCTALDAALSGNPALFTGSAAAILAPTGAAELFRARTFTLKLNDSIDPGELCERLVELDYDNEIEVQVPGEFARRGGILDIFTPLSRLPVRLEFFGSTIDSMRLFDPETQRSTEPVNEIRIVPRGELKDLELDEANACFADYLSRETLLVFCDAVLTEAHLQEFSAQFLPAWNELRRERSRTVFLDSIADSANSPELPCLDPGIVMLTDLEPAMIAELGEDSAARWHWQQLRGYLRRWHSAGHELVACCGSHGEAERFAQMLNEDEIMRAIPITVEAIRIPQGLLLSAAGLVLLSERELFGKHMPRQAPAESSAATRFRERRHENMELEEGGFAVHATHGIAVYHGIREIDGANGREEMLELEFADDARLYVPLDQAHLVSRYVGGTRKYPTLSSLGGSAWKKAKTAAAGAAWDLAADLLRLNAVRRQTQGVCFTPEATWEQALAEAFPYTETEDQTIAIRDVLADMENPQPMDRLLCGDVGYGKTEIAVRAAFRAVMNQKQVAVLVPTTILCQQHFQTFRERLAEYPVIIENLSRLRSAAEQAAVLEKLATGGVDIVIGTHRLVQKDVVFADLGLVIIDEEQRFGVRHKESFKRLRSTVDVLTMTATPIPRTLYFSLAGLRHLSTILTPPAARLPVRTIISEYDETVIREAIIREIERRGQVFFLHNRVQTITKICQHLRELVPEARFAVGHGQLQPRELEGVMRRFMNAEIDVLVCTTIIESGLDIPNANTIIIDRADRFGLADLYQLRGRVGRYHRQAYAYLLLPPLGSLPRNARERLAAIRRYTHLGAGFKLAMRDLEIRGAGNILGSEQSGHIAAIGFELYCELLDEAVARLDKGIDPAKFDVPIRLPGTTGIGGGGDRTKGSGAFIPGSYIHATGIRIDCYKRLRQMTTEAELDSFRAELHDRFGALPREAENLLLLHKVRILAANAGIRSITSRDGKLLLEKKEGGYLNQGTEKLPRLPAGTLDEQLQEIIKLLT